MELRNSMSISSNIHTYKSSRESNIELLRLLAGMGVIVLHFNYFPGGGGALETASGVNFYVLLVLEILCVSAVNIFILISGYYGCESKKIKIGKLITLLLQTICLQFAMTLCGCLLRHEWNIRTIISSLIPANYYVILYIVLMIFAPFINKLIRSLDGKDLLFLIILLFTVFSVYATAVDVIKEITGISWIGLSSVGWEGSMAGYSIVNFVLVYILGAYLRKTDFFVDWPLSRLLISLCLGVLCIYVWRNYLPNTAWIYCNPVLILESCIILTIFCKIKLKSNLINKLAPASFTCFLIQNNILRYIDCSGIADKNLLLMFIFLVIVLLGIYFLAYIVMNLFDFLYNLSINRIVEKIPDFFIL